MRSVTFARGFLADPIWAMNDGRFPRNEMQLYLCIGRIRGEIKETVTVHAQIPRVDPGEPIPGIETGFAKTPATRFLMEQKSFPVRVRDREMSELQIINDKSRSGCSALGQRTNSLPEKS